MQPECALKRWAPQRMEGEAMAGAESRAKQARCRRAERRRQVKAARSAGVTGLGFAARGLAAGAMVAVAATGRQGVAATPVGAAVAHGAASAVPGNAASGAGAVGGAATPAGAAESGAASAAGAVPEAPELLAKKYEIAAGPLDGVLKEFERQSGLRLKVAMKPEVMAGFQSPGLHGSYKPGEALELLLEGTGLTSAVQDAGTMGVGLSRADTATVTAEIPDTVAMTKFTEPLIDTPQSVVAVPQFALHDESANTLRAALQNVPGISMAAGEFGAQGDNLTIRGFTARNDIFLDGIRDFGSYYRDSFDYDQVEVLEGPAGVQFGRGSTGGIINQESKLPAAQPFFNAQTQLGTDATKRLAIDVNQPLDGLADTLGEAFHGAALRLNAVATDGGVAGRPFAANRHFGVAPSLEFGMNGATRGSISYLHLTEDDTPDYGLPWLYNGVAPASRHAYFGFADADYLRASVDAVTLRGSHDVTPGVQLHSIARWANYGRNAKITEPQICSNASMSVPVGGFVTALPTSSVTGLTCTVGPATPASQIAVNRNQLQVRSVEGDLWDQTELTAKFKVLGVVNHFAGGVEGGQEISDPVRTSYTIKTGSLSLNSAPATNLADPEPREAFSGSPYVQSVTHTTSKSVALYFVDTMKLTRYFELSGGVRWDYFDTDFNLYAPQTAVKGAVLTAAIPPISQVVHQPTYRAALVYKPTAHGSVYFDYGTSFNPSAESLSLSVSSSLLPPEENETYEVGAKYSFLGDRLMVDGAWFRTTKLNARETDPTNSNNIVLSGNQLVRGVQASAVGRLSNGFDLVLGYAYLHSETTYSKFFPTAVGYGLANVPQSTFNAFLTHRLLFGVKGGVGGNYVGNRLASSTVPYTPLSFGPAQTFAAGAAPCGTAATTCYEVLSTGAKQVPSYWVFNAMASKPITERIELQANVYNLANRFYIDQPHPSHLIPGPGLSALIGANFRF